MSDIEVVDRTAARAEEDRLVGRLVRRHRARLVATLLLHGWPRLAHELAAALGTTVPEIVDDERRAQRSRGTP